MKHIVVIGKYYPPEIGGLERYTYDVARVAARAHRVTVLVHNSTRNDSIEVSGNVTLIRCGTNKVIKAQPISFSMLSHMRGLRPDLILFNAPNFWAAGMLALTRYRGPLIVTHHADVFGRPLLKRAVLPIYHRLLKRAACVIVNSLKNASSSKDLPKGTGPLVVIPHGIEASLYQVDESDRQALLRERRERFGEGPVIGFIGRFVRYKGLSVIVDALTRLSDTHVLMIGDGPLRQETENKAREAGVSERMHFFGNIDEATKIRKLAIMDVLLLPSTDTTEAFGVAQIEAQLMSVPVIASRLPTGITDVTIDNETGLLVPPRDPDALAAAIACLTSDRALATRLGQAGRRHALSNFTFDVFRERFEDLFRVLLTKGRLSD
jgi:glycosyltransferase involved in cell wall biosynthesis